MWNDLKTVAHSTVHSNLEHSEGLRELPKLAVGLGPDHSSHCALQRFA